MTPEEIRETLFRTLDKLDELYVDRSAREEVLQKEREAHSLEVRNLKIEKDRALAEKDRALAEKDNRIAALEQELAESKAARVDAEHKVNSMNQEKYQGTTKKGIDKKHVTKKGRDDDKGDFDGTSDSASPKDGGAGCEANGSGKADGVETITRDRSDIAVEKSRTRGKYTLADATETPASPSFHTESHRGAKIRSILRSFVETCKLEGIGIVKYFTSFFEAVCSGRTDYENLLPATITLSN